jgi:hypothetical protein
MGLFYTNVTLYKAQQQQIADFLTKQKRIAYVSPTQGEYTVVYDKETEDQDTRVLKKLSESLTRQFKCKALSSLVHDSDVFMYWLYDRGKLLDTYNSMPGYFDPDTNKASPEGGDVKKLCLAFEKLDESSNIEHIFDLVAQGNLDIEAEEFLLGEDIHGALVQALSMPSFAAYTGYYTIENSDLPEASDRNVFIKVPDIKIS